MIFETAVVNEPSVFEALKFYYSFKSKLPLVIKFLLIINITLNYNLLVKRFLDFFCPVGYSESESAKSIS